jgi:predicted DNA-binding WGR domain protein
MGTRRFEFADKTSRKFWEVSVVGAETRVRFGRLGTEGQLKTKPHDNAQVARVEADKLIREKAGKGYTEVRSAKSARAPAAKAKARAPARPAKPQSGKWLSYEKPSRAWAHFCLKGRKIDFAQGQPGFVKEWDETFGTTAEAQTRAARVIVLLEDAQYELKAAKAKKPPLVLGNCLPKYVEEVELDEKAAAEAVEGAVEFRKFYAQSQKDLRPTTRAVDAGKLAARWVECATRLNGNEPLTVEARFGKPASAKAIAQTEKVLGIKLPPSLRSFLATHDGAEILINYPPHEQQMFFQLCSTKELQESWRHIRDWPKVAEGELIAHLRPLMSFSGSSMIAFDTREASKSGEYAVVSFEKMWTPDDYTRLAPDFGSFLSTMIDDFFMLRHEHSQKRFDAVKSALTKIAAKRG